MASGMRITGLAARIGAGSTVRCPSFTSLYRNSLKNCQAREASNMCLPISTPTSAISWIRRSTAQAVQTRTYANSGLNDTNEEAKENELDAPLPVESDSIKTETPNDITVDTPTEVVVEVEANTKSSDSVTHIPWYLQHQAKSFPSSFSPTGAGPETTITIPDNSPICLPAIVEEIRNTYGLIDPVLLDLRHITSPPPALGPNLIMIIATAHSERHLHIAADKLCRWLRTEWKFHPRADGVLGRNELKIRRRRYARKMRALAMTSLGEGEKDKDGSAWRGAGHDGLPDDGFSTGWVCVHVPIKLADGVVSGGVSDLESEGTATETKTTLEAETEILNAREPTETELDPETETDSDDPIGFWDMDVNVATIVLQLVTPPSRKRLNLEGLWTNRSDEARARIAQLESQPEA